jgi:hypothetical protein
MMAARQPGKKPARSQAPDLERLDTRVLMATGLGPRLGHFAQPGVVPSIIHHGHLLQPGVKVNDHRALNRALLSVLGPGFDRLANLVEMSDPTTPNNLPQRVLSNLLIHQVLEDNDTFQLLGQPWLSAVFSSQQLTSNNSQGTVTLTLPRTNHLLFLGNPSIVQVLPGDPAPNGGVFNFGFILEVPSTDLVFNPDNTTMTLTVPLTLIPAQAQSIVTGINSQTPNNLSAIYGATGQELVTAFRSSVAAATPTGVSNLPGLRLVNALEHNGNFPVLGDHLLFRYMRAAQANNLLSPDPQQISVMNTAITTFLGITDNWTTTSLAQFQALIAANPGGSIVPTPVKGPLKGTLAVSFGVVQQPNAVQNPAPERIDVGYVFARNGDYGIVLSARGPLSNTVPVPAPNTIVAGDLQTQVSNAKSLSELGGWRVVEGLQQGTVLSGGIAATNSGGVATFAASAGYGFGLEYGLSVQYTQVIPLGNIFTGPFE